MNPSDATARSTLRDAAQQTLADLSGDGGDVKFQARRLKAISSMVLKDLEETPAADDGIPVELHEYLKTNA